VVKIDFGSTIGIKTCYPMTMEEMRSMLRCLRLDEAGVYAAGLNWFVEYLVTPTAICHCPRKSPEGLGQRFSGLIDGVSGALRGFPARMMK
jgi:hypothetical protein